MPSITSWMRLEPRSRDAEMNTSLQARIYDPLWLLARQWQFGEFQGEDNGSPVMARWRAESAPLTRYHSGAIPPNTRVDAPNYDGSRMPLETLVERETVRPAADQTAQPEKLRLAAEAGQQFLRMLRTQPLSRDYREAFIAEYPFPALSPEQRAALDRDSLGFFDLMASARPRRPAALCRLPLGGRGRNCHRPPFCKLLRPIWRKSRRPRGSGCNGIETLFSEPDVDNSIVVAGAHGVCVFGGNSAQRWRVHTDGAGIF